MFVIRRLGTSGVMVIVSKSVNVASVQLIR